MKSKTLYRYAALIFLSCLTVAILVVQANPSVQGEKPVNGTSGKDKNIPARSTFDERMARGKAQNGMRKYDCWIMEYCLLSELNSRDYSIQYCHFDSPATQNNIFERHHKEVKRKSIGSCIY